MRVDVGRKSKQRKEKRMKPPVPEHPPEERRSEAATVAWMLSALFTSVMLAIHFGVRLLLTVRPELNDSIPRLTVIPGLSLFMALIGGGFALFFTPLVLKFRKSPPPDAVTFGVVIVAVVPFLLVVVQIARG